MQKNRYSCNVSQQVLSEVVASHSGGGGGGVEIPLVFSSCGNQDKIRSGSYAEFLPGNKKISNQENISLVEI